LRPVRVSGSGPQAGLTLFELLVVLAIMGLAAVVAAPRVTDLMAKSQFRNEVTRTVTFLRQAMVDAVYGGEKVSVVLDPEGRTLSTDRMKVLMLPEDMTVTVTSWQGYESSGGTVAEFYPNGTAWETELVLANLRGERRVIRIEPLGGWAAVVNKAEE